MSQKADDFLRTFFELELTWIADKPSWFNAKGDHFVTTIMLYTEAWFTIVRNRKECLLTDQQINRVHKLYDMLAAFQVAIPDFPERPSEYRALCDNPDWKKIQQYAKELYDSIYPHVRKSTLKGF